MTQQEWANIMAMLVLAWPRFEVKTGQTALYGRMLADLDCSEVQQAAQTLIAESPWFPSIADIRIRVVERRLALPSPAEAWEAVAMAALHGGGYLHPVVRRALDSVGGSWAVRTSENLTTLRAQFERLYTDLRAQELKRETLQGLGLAVPLTRRLAAAEPQGGLPQAEPEYMPREEAARLMRQLSARMEQAIEGVPDGED
jgi:hypothetical protein